MHIKPLEGNFADRVIEYIKVVHRLISKRVFIIANCCDLMTTEYYTELEKACSYEEVQAVLINGHLVNKEANINEITIDSDFCEI